MILNKQTKINRCDLHIHTKYSYDSNASIEEYILKAIDNNIDILCFTDHIECSIEKNTFDSFDFINRNKEIDELKAKYQSKIKILVGYEVGEPHKHLKEVEYLRSLNPDMIIGSIHRPFHGIGKTNKTCTNKEYLEQYYLELLEMVKVGNFDVMGHIDFCKKMCGNDYIENKEVFHEALRILASKNIPIEINDSPRRLGYKEPFPHKELVDYYYSVGGKYVEINSDAHEVNDLGHGYYDILKTLNSGLKLCYFEKGEIKEA